MQITKIIHTETGHRLVRYAGKCAHLHGHRLIWEVTVTAPDLDDTGFIMDYSDLKTVLKDTVDMLDHAFIMSIEDPIHVQLGSDNEATAHFLRATNGDTPRLFIVPFNPTSENIVPWMAIRIQTALPEHVELIKIKMWETESSFTEWMVD